MESVAEIGTSAEIGGPPTQVPSVAISAPVARCQRARQAGHVLMAIY